MIIIIPLTDHLPTFVLTSMSAIAALTRFKTLPTTMSMTCCGHMLILVAAGAGYAASRAWYSFYVWCAYCVLCTPLMKPIALQANLMANCSFTSRMEPTSPKGTQ